MILNAENLKCSFLFSLETVRNDLVLKIPQKLQSSILQYFN
jgi:hypothetical protein